MKRFTVIVILLSSILLFSMVSLSAEPISLMLGHVAASGDNVDKVAHMFADLVSEKTDGAVEVKVYPASQLGDYAALFENLKPGLVHVVIESIAPLEPVSQLASIDAYPYLFRDADHLISFINSDLGDEFFQAVGAGEVRIMGAHYRGTRFMNSKKPVYTADDIEGLKVRVPTQPMYVKTWELLGAICTPMSFNDIYTSLQQGVVDAQENPLGQSYTAGFAEVTNYLINTGHVVGMMAFHMDEGFFTSLPAEYRDAIEEAAKEAAAWRTELERSEEDSYIQKFIDDGIEYIEADKDSFKEKTSTIIDYFPYLADWVNKIKEFK